jgi:hypothetical protein
MASSAGGGDVLIFHKLTFFVGQRVPTRSLYIDRLRRNGGTLVLLEKDAQIHIADHFRREQNPANSISYDWIDKSIAANRLQDTEAYRAGPAVAAPRPVGGLKPAKGSRTPYTVADDEILWHHVKAAERRGQSTKGNEIFKQLEESNGRHPWQSWRDRWIKYVCDKTFPEEAEVDEIGIAPSPATVAPARTTQQPQSKRSVSAHSNEDAELPSTSKVQTNIPTNARVAKKSSKPQEPLEISEAATARTLAAAAGHGPSLQSAARGTWRNASTARDNGILQPDAESEDLPPAVRRKAQEATRMSQSQHAKMSESVMQSREFSIPPPNVHSTNNAPVSDSTLSAARSPDVSSAFTQDEHDMLLAAAPDIERVAVKHYEKAWIMLADRHPQHTVKVWKRYYKEVVLPEYNLIAVDTEDETVEDDEDTDRRIELGSASASSSFVEVMKLKSPKSSGTTPTSNMKRKREDEELPSNSHPDPVPESNTKKVRTHPGPIIVDLDTVESCPPAGDVATPRAPLVVTPRAEEQEDNEMETDEPEGEIGDVHGKLDHSIGHVVIHTQLSANAADSQQSWNGFSPEPDEEEQSVAQLEAQESQQSWKGISPEKDAEAAEKPEFKLYDEVDEVIEDGEENILPDGEVLLQSIKPRTHHGALLDVTRDIVSQQEIQETQSTEDWHDASESSIRTRSMKVAPVSTPDILKPTSRLPRNTISESDEEDLEDRWQKLANEPSAQLLRESAQRDEDEMDVVDEQQFTNGNVSADEEVIDQIYHEEESINGDAVYELRPMPDTATLYDQPVFDSDQILPEDESQAQSDELPTPTPRKRAAQPQDMLPSGEGSVSDIEDYTIVAPLAESEPALPVIDIEDEQASDNNADQPITSIELDYLDTQGILQAETQALDADLPPPASSQDLQDLGGWLKEQKSKLPDSDASFAPSSPGVQKAATPPASRKRAVLAAAARQRRESSSALALGDDLLPFQRSQQRSPSPQQLPQIPEDEDEEEMKEVETDGTTTDGTTTDAETEGTLVTSPKKVIQTWMAYEEAQGATKELALFALQRTSANTRLASQVLDSVANGRGLPKNVRGIWSEEDDQMMLEILEQPAEGSNLTYRLRREKLIKLHGRDAYTTRLQLLMPTTHR